MGEPFGSCVPGLLRHLLGDARCYSWAERDVADTCVAMWDGGEPQPLFRDSPKSKTVCKLMDTVVCIHVDTCLIERWFLGLSALFVLSIWIVSPWYGCCLGGV